MLFYATVKCLSKGSLGPPHFGQALVLPALRRRLVFIWFSFLPLLRNSFGAAELHSEREHHQLRRRRHLRHHHAHRPLHRLQPQVHHRQRRQESHCPGLQFRSHRLSFPGF